MRQLNQFVQQLHESGGEGNSLSRLWFESFTPMSLAGTFLHIHSLEAPGFQELLLLSEEEGFRFLRRLKQEWETGINRFDQEGEGFFGWTIENQLVATLGINQVAHAPHNGRLRRMYLHPAYRRKGIGSQMIHEIILRYRSRYQMLELFTDTLGGAHFYESLGFSPIFDLPKVSHQLSLHA